MVGKTGYTDQWLVISPAQGLDVSFEGLEVIASKEKICLSLAGDWFAPSWHLSA